jgi:hypothetical protein
MTVGRVPCSPCSQADKPAAQDKRWIADLAPAIAAVAAYLIDIPASDSPDASLHDSSAIQPRPFSFKVLRCVPSNAVDARRRSRRHEYLLLLNGTLIWHCDGVPSGRWLVSPGSHPVAAISALRSQSSQVGDTAT